MINNAIPGTVQGACPACGYCPHCGRGAQPHYGVPYFQDQPTWYTNIGTPSPQTPYFTSSQRTGSGE